MNEYILTTAHASNRPHRRDFGPDHEADDAQNRRHGRERVAADPVRGDPFRIFKNLEHDGNRRQDRPQQADIIVPAALGDDSLFDADDQPGNDPAHQADEADRLDPHQGAAEQRIPHADAGIACQINPHERDDRPGRQWPALAAGFCRIRAFAGIRGVGGAATVCQRQHMIGQEVKNADIKCLLSVVRCQVSVAVLGCQNRLACSSGTVGSSMRHGRPGTREFSIGPSASFVQKSSRLAQILKRSIIRCRPSDLLSLPKGTDLHQT